MNIVTNKQRILFTIFVLVFSVFIFTGGVWAVEDYGAEGVQEKDQFTLEEMLKYAIQDEYLAKAEYELIMQEFGEQRPFSNIMQAEEYHIEILLPLFKKYNIEIPLDLSDQHVILPDDIKTALETGVNAEIVNIEMYEKFLDKEDLPADVAEVFEELKRGSENHLEAFRNGLNRSEKRNYQNSRRRNSN